MKEMGEYGLVPSALTRSLGISMEGSQVRLIVVKLLSSQHLCYSRGVNFIEMASGYSSRWVYISSQGSCDSRNPLVFSPPWALSCGWWKLNSLSSSTSFRTPRHPVMFPSWWLCTRATNYTVSSRHGIQRTVLVRLSPVLCTQNKPSLVTSNVVLKKVCLLQGHQGTMYCHKEWKNLFYMEKKRSWMVHRFFTLLLLIFREEN